MPTRSIITNQGMELLASSTTFTGNYYWLGYYALAYVPNFWKDDDGDNLIDIPNCPDQMVNPTGSDPLQGPNTIISSDVDKLNTNMTRLTKYGDMIWNIFQGDLVGPGFVDGISDGSIAGDLYGLTLYSANVKKHYRYVLDDNGNNNLVAWIIDPSNTDLMLGAYRYRGTDGFVSSGMPVPAPLYYFGDASKDNTIELPPFSITQYINDFALDTGADVYPFIECPVSPSLATFIGEPNITIPKVSADFRGYFDSTGATTNSPVTHGTFFDSNEIPAANLAINNVNGWYDAASSYLGFTRPYLDEFYNLISVSNYNRYHAPVGAAGNILNSDLKNRNMAKVSKLFPIFDFSVINSQKGLNSNGESREVATGISLTIDLDLAPLLRTQGYTNVDPSSGVGIYDQESDLTLQDRYNNINNNSTPNPNDIPLFNSTKTSFKFNRIGIYAVPVRKAPSSSTQDPLTVGKDISLDVEIDPDSEPVLFAVIDWDNTQYLSDTGDGAHQFRAQFNVNLESPDGVEETPLIRDTAVFYNLYNNNALNWYRNQLLANASTQHAIIELQQQVANLAQKISKSSITQCCDTGTGNNSGTVIGGNISGSGDNHRLAYFSDINVLANSFLEYDTNTFGDDAGGTISHGHISMLGTSRINFGIDEGGFPAHINYDSNTSTLKIFAEDFNGISLSAGSSAIISIEYLDSASGYGHIARFNPSYYGANGLISGSPGYGLFNIGSFYNAKEMQFSANEIQTIDTGGPSPLQLNPYGGIVITPAISTFGQADKAMTASDSQSVANLGLLRIQADNVGYTLTLTSPTYGQHITIYNMGSNAITIANTTESLVLRAGETAMLQYYLFGGTWYWTKVSNLLESPLLEVSSSPFTLDDRRMFFFTVDCDITIPLASEYPNREIWLFFKDHTTTMYLSGSDIWSGLDRYLGIGIDGSHVAITTVTRGAMLKSNGVDTWYIAQLYDT